MRIEPNENQGACQMPQKREQEMVDVGPETCDKRGKIPENGVVFACRDILEGCYAVGKVMDPRKWWYTLETNRF